uniref:Uncharacterized protein n=1 Tax=Oncorhynchus kisutch TaxID=8019 RepID=A0A8C7MBX9_ONCKI
MSSRKRSLYSEDRGYRKRHNEPKQDVEKLKKQATKTEPRSAKVKTYEKPPGFIKEDYKPEDCIPADPGNEDARDFLVQAPTKGLWMPQGKGVKVMQCELEMHCSLKFWAHEDPMYDMIRENKQNEKETTFWTPPWSSEDTSPGHRRTHPLVI